MPGVFYQNNSVNHKSNLAGAPVSRYEKLKKNVRIFGLNGGIRSFSTTKVWSKTPLIPISEAKKFPDLSIIDPVYDDISENKSVIDLWRKQLMKEKRIDSDVSKDSIEKELNSIHKLKYPDIADPVPIEKFKTPEKNFLSNNDDLVYTKDLGITLDDFKNLTTKVILVRRTVQMTRKGKIPSMTALVVVGNCRGSAGYGEGKDADVPGAILKATRKAIRNMQYFPRYDDRTIYHDVYHKFKACKLYFWARKPGFGCRTNPVIHEISKCIGISDMSSKCRGSRNPLNVVKGTFEALSKQKLPENISRARGLKLVDVNHVYYGGE
ncbi:putative 37S ribosomal protein S5, mitochondrial [Zancudomyces culisetae]|uniref:Small ribosomal subunit protein uS5m n=1 Tax=Zancudomyces culisetae TaxID=1213189 RepID=A0A1R1PTV7_ZANCU|nr:putative 37S ribosomal protein S5, mitochondrial [Zancudomyces culisetae]|eukprot:OMH84400.1 putative 37S ribosomal protein S5, mitochondrial [Zancudomyces culisetae]